jgi:preprotein translocase subunit SecY
MILFISIVSRFPNQIASMISRVAAEPKTWWVTLLMIVGALAIVVLIIIVTNAERRIPVQYSKRVVGRKQYGGQSTHLPMKVNMSGVLPVIFAQSIASLPATVAAFVPRWSNGWFIRLFDTNTVTYIVLYFLLIIFFSYFYSTIQFNPIEVANNLKKNGGFIPGFRAGKPTSEFIQKVLNKITMFGAIYLAIVAIVPLIISACSATARNSGVSLGGTSVIIVVGVALETVKALESQMLMRHYKGFLE